MERICPFCGQKDRSGRWTLEECLAWVNDCIRWRGEVLHGHHIHWCFEYDGLPVDETSQEYAHCNCFGEKSL